MNYEITHTQEDRDGYVYYMEDGVKLPFYWEFMVGGFDIYVPTPEKWDSFCEQHDASRAKGRRQEILQRVAEETHKKKAKGAKVSIDDTGISFSFEGSLINRLLHKILGV